MTVQQLPFRAWPEAYCCTLGPLELVVVASIGPRILSLRVDGGHNLLYEDTTDFRVGAWRLYGGHRFSIAPESDLSYLPDNQTCEVVWNGENLAVLERIPALGLKKTLRITPARSVFGKCLWSATGPRSQRAKGGDRECCDRGPVVVRPECDIFQTGSEPSPGFEILHQVTNEGPQDWRGAVWAITCVPATGQVVIPWPGGSIHEREHPLRFWAHPLGNYAPGHSPQWQCAPDHFVVQPSGETGKVGLHASRAWLAWVGQHGTFVITAPVVAPPSRYPDGGCNLEVFTSAAYLELETLGPIVTLRPGESTVHIEHWQIWTRDEWMSKNAQNANCRQSNRFRGSRFQLQSKTLRHDETLDDESGRPPC